MSDYEYWLEMKRLAEGRVEEVKVLVATAKTASKLWWYERLLKTNRDWLNLAIYQINQFETHQNKLVEREAFKRATFRGNDD